VANLEAQAKTAAAGRHTLGAGATSLYRLAHERGYSPAAARIFAAGRHGISEAVTNIAGLTARCFAWIPDPEDSTTWQLQIARSDEPDSAWQPDEDLVRSAVSQLPGIAGYDKAIDIPASALPGVKSVLRSAWIACGADVDQMPAELNQEALRREFLKLGLSETAAAIAARGRGRVARRS